MLLFSHSMDDGRELEAGQGKGKGCKYKYEYDSGAKCRSKGSMRPLMQSVIKERKKERTVSGSNWICTSF